MKAVQAGVAVVLAIVCVNLAGLLVARATKRERELTVRAALGAGRGRLLQHVLAEAGLLTPATKRLPAAPRRARLRRGGSITETIRLDREDRF